MSSCIIEGNSDIAGIGVRAAIYLQASIAIVISILHEGDSLGVKNEQNDEYETLQSPIPPPHAVGGSYQPEVTQMGRSKRKALVERDFGFIKHILKPELTKAADRTLERSLFVTGWALVISALVMAFSPGNYLTDYHVLVVLNLSFVNYWAGFDMLRRRALVNYYENAQDAQAPSESSGSRQGVVKFGLKNAFIVPYTLTHDPRSIVGTWLPFYLHATMFSVLGLIFWAKPDIFRSYHGLTDLDDPTSICNPPVVYWAMGPVPLPHKPLQIASLVFYSISAIPIINGFFTEVVSAFAASLLAMATTALTMPFLLVVLASVYLISSIIDLLRAEDTSRESFAGMACTYVARLFNSFSSINRRITTLVYTGPIIYWIAATEMLVKSNEIHVNSDERGWGYGQTMAILTACMAVAFYALQIVEDRQERKKKEEKERISFQGVPTVSMPIPEPLKSIMPPQALQDDAPPAFVDIKPPVRVPFVQPCFPMPVPHPVPYQAPSIAARSKSL